MNRAWLVLLGIVVLLAVSLSLVHRLPHRAAAPGPPPPEAPIDTLRLRVGVRAIEPARAEATLGHRLALWITNERDTPVTLALSGYEHQFAGRVLAPGASERDTLVLDLPGEDFAWMLEGKPVARLRIAGSHMMEGHR